MVVNCTSGIERDEDNGYSCCSSQTEKRCQVVGKCVCNCAGYGNVCPYSASVAGRAASLAVSNLFSPDSTLFTKPPEYPLVSLSDLIIHEKLGEGGFSCVYRVSMKQDEKSYAIKYLLKKNMVNQQTFELGASDLAVEAIFLSKLKHKNIIQLHGVATGSIETNFSMGQERGFFIIIDFLASILESRIEQWRETADHGTLLSRLSHEFKEKRRLALLDRLKVAIDLTDAMIYLHSLNIIFRDLKPDNIGFDTSGTLKLYDFGLAKEVKPCYLNGSQKLTGNTGSRRYMAPEVAKEQSYGLPADVFSFGILLYEISSLEKPFQGYNATKHMKQVVMAGERPRLDTASASWFPFELHWLIKRCWSSSPSDRPTFSSCKEVLEDIVKSTSSGKTRSPRAVLKNSPSSQKNVKNLDPTPADKLPNFHEIKPVPKPTRQTKSLGFLQKH